VRFALLIFVVDDIDVRDLSSVSGLT